ncbi:hypothetical protein EUGRSUZ_D00379 [Eucalyptus grandis]|uniref:Uncharacterized protein n=2 Tax=Eucalyptus grandis TaxID=71139 RepID=A0ACC3L4P3_EUCGR|nr:hypothetical protein EUGRSUZ_D00379 [Eucalyptus grandis]
MLSPLSLSQRQPPSESCVAIITVKLDESKVTITTKLDESKAHHVETKGERDKRDLTKVEPSESRATRFVLDFRLGTDPPGTN